MKLSVLCAWADALRSFDARAKPQSPIMTAKLGVVIAGTVFAISLDAGPSVARGQDIVVFGDSLSDVGNVLAFSSSPEAAALGFTPRPTVPFYQRGQFTNGIDGRAGLVSTQFTQGSWVNVFADRLGRSRPAASGVLADTAPIGTNYAWGGALASEASVLPSSSTQVDFFVRGRSRVPSDSVYTFWFGGNDLINAASDQASTPSAVIAAGNGAISAMRGSISRLIDVLDPNAPAKILWANLPALDRTPIGQSLPENLRQALGQASANFRNAQLGVIAELEAMHANVDIVPLDVFGLFNQVLDGPGAFGIVDATTPVLVGPDFTTPGPFVPTVNVPSTANPDEYVFWDRLHPTSRMHVLIGELAASVIPAPSTGAMMVFVLAGASWRRRREPSS